VTTGAGYFQYCPICGSPLVERFVEDEERNRLVCESCGHILYLNPKLVAGAIPVVDGKVWLLRRAIEPRYGAWTFPAGFMEMGESVEEAAARETREELGIEIEIESLLNVYSRPTTPTVLTVYVARALSRPTGGRETLEYALFSPNDIPWDDLAFWNTVDALKDWIEQYPHA
jgi:ADP-ribose pyrophosphatase YjhB (NUDIX family)